MSAEKTLELLKKLKEDPKAKDLLDGLKNTASADDVISCYAQIAAKLGYDITAEEIREVVNQEEARRKSETEKIASDMKALNDDDVEDVTGGASRYQWDETWYEGCKFTHDGSCAIQDACVSVRVNYLCDADWSDPNCDFTFYCQGSMLEYGQTQ